METTDKTFQKEVIEGSMKTPILVDFWSPTCGPCLALSPVLEKLEKDFKGKFKLAKVNVAKSSQNAIVYGVSAVPSIKLFKDGKVVEEFLGYRPEEDVKEWLDDKL